MPGQRFAVPEHRDDRSRRELDRVERQFLARPLQGDGIDSRTQLAVSEAKVVALLPALSRKRVGIEDGCSASRFSGRKVS